MKHIIFAALAAFLLAGCFHNTPDPVTPEQLPVKFDAQDAPIYGAANAAQAVLPVWSLQVYWRSRSSPDVVGPILTQMQLQTRPTLSDVAKYVPLPKVFRDLKLVYVPCSIDNIVQVGPQQPIELPEKETK